MTYLPNTKSFLLDHTRLLTALASLLLSIVLVVTDDIINKDGILYLETAAAFLSGGIHAAAELYNWPFYSILIAIVHRTTQLPLELSAISINIVFFVFLTDSLYRICRRILPTEQHLFIGILLFLVFYGLNEYRDFLIRDVGYWAFSIFGLLLFMDFLEQPRWKTAIYWQLSLLTAALFRPEAIFILCALPLFALFYFPGMQRVYAYFKLSLLLLIISLLFIGFIYGQSDALPDLSKLQEIFPQNIGELITRIQNKGYRVSLLLPEHSKQYGTLIYTSGLLYLLIFLIAEAIHIAYIGLYFIARRGKSAIQHPHRHLLFYVLFLYLSILVAFLLFRHFMVTRYCIMAVLLLLLLMLPSITDYIITAWRNKNRFILILFSTMLVLSLYAGISYSVSKSYIKKTAVWASEQSPNNHLIATDDVFIHYYFNAHATQSGHHPITLLQTEDSTDAYDQLIYVEKRKHPLSKTRLNMLQSRQIIYSQQNQHGDKASIYE